MNVTLNHKINSLIGADIAFAVYYLPSASEVRMIAGGIESFEEFTSESETLEGFVFAPYESSVDCPSLLIKSDYLANGEEAIVQLLQDLPEANSLKKDAGLSLSMEMAKEDFEAIVAKAVSEINEKDDLQKVVLSRVKHQNLTQDFDAYSLLHDLHQSMPNAFAYMAHIPGQGLWMGATPERLLEVEGGRAQTNALAGTLANGSAEEWSEKEIDEQAIVSEYIIERLKEAGISQHQMQGPEEIASGSVRHLRSVFSFELNTQAQTLAVINALHPTPAICGMSKAKADAFIKENENYSREYYTGYLGPLGLDNASHIFVNLRCMKIVETNAALYVGAGITAGSIPEKEWDETGVKTMTLLNVIRK